MTMVPVAKVVAEVAVDEDDRRKEGSFNRLIGLVYCGNDGINNKKSLNDLLLNGGHAVIYQDFATLVNFLQPVGYKDMDADIEYSVSTFFYIFKEKYTAVFVLL